MNYYCLIAGLRELTADGEKKGFDAAEIIADIRVELSRTDIRVVDLLYAALDIENIVAHRQKSDRYNPLGRVTKEDLGTPTGLPERVQKIIAGYSEENEDEDFEATEKFERALWEAWYAECAASKSKFLRKWGESDRVIRSIIAGLKLTDADEELAERIKSIIGVHNLVERERQLANLRWELADSYSEMHYFDIDAVLAYLVKVNIVASRLRLDATQGRELLNRMVNELKIKS